MLQPQKYRTPLSRSFVPISCRRRWQTEYRGVFHNNHVSRWTRFSSQNTPQGMIQAGSDLPLLSARLTPKSRSGTHLQEYAPKRSNITYQNRAGAGRSACVRVDGDISGAIARLNQHQISICIESYATQVSPDANSWPEGMVRVRTRPTPLRIVQQFQQFQGICLG